MTRTSKSGKNYLPQILKLGPPNPAPSLSHWWADQICVNELLRALGNAAVLYTAEGQQGQREKAMDQVTVDMLRSWTWWSGFLAMSGDNWSWRDPKTGEAEEDDDVMLQVSSSLWEPSSRRFPAMGYYAQTKSTLPTVAKETFRELKTIKSSMLFI